MQPIVYGLEDVYGEQIVFRELDARAEGEAAFIEAALPGHPSVLILLPDGREAFRGFGLQTEAQLEAAIEVVLADPSR